MLQEEIEKDKKMINDINHETYALKAKFKELQVDLLFRLKMRFKSKP